MSENKVPINTGKRNPTAKKIFSLDDYKKKIGNEDVEQKPLSWYVCSPALQKATGLPGFPKGYVSLCRGFSNTGKSTSLLEAAINAQKQGDLPILIDTENNMGRKRMEKMGFDWKGNFIYIDNQFILNNFGKKKNKDRNQATIEDQADMIYYFLNQQEIGELPFNIVFCIDSLGTLDCIKSVNAQEKDTNNNNRWNAGAFEATYKSILNSRIPSSRKITLPYVNSIIAVQKIWIDSTIVGTSIVRHKGGESFFHGARLIYHHGGIISHGTRAISAVSKDREVTYGIETKIGVEKNHIDGDLGGISLEGKLISTPHGFISSEPEDIKEYKKQHIKFFRDILGEDINAEELMTKYHQIQIIGDDVEQHIDDFNDSMKNNFGNLNVDKETGEIKE